MTETPQNESQIVQVSPPDAPTEREGPESMLASTLLKAFGNERIAFFESERGVFYLNILYQMLMLRREHELQPLHDDLYYAVRPAQLLLNPEYDKNQFASDIAQLLEWGNLTKVLEPYRLRSYKDHSRENFRYVLNENTVEFLQWLEYRVRARAQGRERGGRNFLQDIVAALQELERLCAAAELHTDAGINEPPRRVLHLMYSVEDHIQDLSSELLEFRAFMVQFVTHAYDVNTLKSILHWLSRYVEIYLQGIYELRDRILAKIESLDTAEARAFVDECHEVIERERQLVPQALRTDVAAERLSAERFLHNTYAFFASGNKLEELCERINQTGREVLKKMDARLRELERRNTRIHDLKARIREIAAIGNGKGSLQEQESEQVKDLFGEGANGKLIEDGAECPEGHRFINALLIPSHTILDDHHWDVHSKAAPPRPRIYSQSLKSAAPKRTLAPKKKTLDEIIETEAKRAAELREWIEKELLRGEKEIRLGELLLEDPAAAQFWMKLMHYRYITPVKDLRPLKVEVEQFLETPASVLLGDHSTGLYTPDHVVKRKS